MKIEGVLPPELSSRRLAFPNQQYQQSACLTGKRYHQEQIHDFCT
jgi:hypothetical protein